MDGRLELHSISECGVELMTFVLRYPDIIHPEMLTHRKFSRNTSSRRAIPVKRFLQAIKDDPFIPHHFGAAQSGMQAYDEVDEETKAKAIESILRCRDACVQCAEELDELGLAKQVINRYVQPFSYVTVILTTTSIEHFMQLRDHEAAEPHIQILARMMKEMRANSTPRVVRAGDWHIPMVTDEERATIPLEDLKKIAIGRCARVSYETHDGIRDIAKDIRLHDDLSVAGHWSPFEHVAQALGLPIPSGNFVGWTQARKYYKNEYKPTPLRPVALTAFCA